MLKKSPRNIRVSQNTNYIDENKRANIKNQHSRIVVNSLIKNSPVRQSAIAKMNGSPRSPIKEYGNRNETQLNHRDLER